MVLPFFWVGWDILKAWYWIFIPFLLVKPFLYLWRWWRRDKWFAGFKFIVLEIKMPKEILKPLRAMEQVFSALWGNIYDPPDWWEEWVDGKMLLSFQMEIVSLGGVPHFFLRIPEKNRNAVESSLYSQYPEAEISVVEDYTKNVPRDIPNKNWKMWGTDYFLIKEDVFPIKTYPKFFEESTQASKEEKRIDPMSTILEGMGKFKQGEQLWIQISACPVTDEDNNFTARGRAIADKLASKPKKAKPKPIIQEAAEALITGKVAEEKQEQQFFWPEMMLTPGEREVVAEVERKVSQYCFECYVRFIYLAKKEVYFGGAKSIPFGYFAQFDTANLNAIIPWMKTITKVHKHWFLPWNLFHPRRLFVRKRSLFKHYKERIPPLWPWAGGTYIFNTEELATIFHFPGRGVAPAPFVPRVEAKKGEAPAGLPIE